MENIANDQDVEIHAGDLTVDVGPVEDYSHIDASVITGEIDAGAFGESHGGLFRSFRKSGSGKYRLHAHVGAGQLTFAARETRVGRMSFLPARSRGAVGGGHARSDSARPR